MSKPVILTGLRANNDLHIGNYFGAVLPLVDMSHTRSNEFQINLFVPDLHSFTTPVDHSKLQANIQQTIKLLVAAGLPLDNPNIYLYRQSYIPAHSELAWILNCFTGFGELSRMAEFKDKSTRLGIEHIGVGQFDYPALMAADMLLYSAKYVPVGDDQRQHIEFTRDIGERLNKRFGELFVIPEPVAKQHEFFGKDQGLRIKDLQDPTKKMSKSDESEKGIIFLNDEPPAAHRKITSATTDNVALVQYDPVNQPGISNLLQIYSLLKGITVNEATREFAGQTQYGEFKKVVADAMAVFLADFQNQLNKIDHLAINAKLTASEVAMNEQANKTLFRVQKAIGLR